MAGLRIFAIVMLVLGLALGGIGGFLWYRGVSDVMGVFDDGSVFYFDTGSASNLVVGSDNIASGARTVWIGFREADIDKKNWSVSVDISSSIGGRVYNETLTNTYLIEMPVDNPLTTAQYNGYTFIDEGTIMADGGVCSVTVTMQDTGTLNSGKGAVAVNEGIVSSFGSLAANVCGGTVLIAIGVLFLIIGFILFIVSLFTGGKKESQAQPVQQQYQQQQQPYPGMQGQAPPPPPGVAPVQPGYQQPPPPPM